MSEKTEQEERITFDEVIKNVKKIMTNSTNLIRMINQSDDDPFRESESKRNFSMIVLNIGNGLIAEEFARYIKGNPSDILIANKVPTIIKP